MMDQQLRSRLSPEDYEAFWQTLIRDGHAGATYWDVFVSDHFTLSDGTDLGPFTEIETDYGSCRLSQGPLPEAARNRDALELILRVKAVPVRCWMELDGPAYWLHESGQSAYLPFTVERSGAD